MPISESIEFKYTTIKAIRDQGIDATALPDIQALDLICLESEAVNQFTGQWFSPVDKVVRLDGTGSQSVHLDELVPIVKVRRVSLLSRGLGSTTSLLLVPEQDFVKTFREIKLISGRSGAKFKGDLGYTSFEAGPIGNAFDNQSFVQGYVRRSEFPEGTQNVEIDGVFGWLEGRKEVETKLDGTVAVGTRAQIAVDSVAGFKVKNIVDVIDSDELSATFGQSLLRFIVNEIDVNTKVLKFDAVELTEALPNDSKVITYGRVPRMVERAVLILVNRIKDVLGSSASASVTITDRIIEERTDNYMYRLREENAEDLGNTRSPFSTGSVEADRLLAHFHAPPYWGVV